MNLSDNTKQTFADYLRLSGQEMDLRGLAAAFALFLILIAFIWGIVSWWLAGLVAGIAAARRSAGFPNFTSAISLSLPLGFQLPFILFAIFAIRITAAEQEEEEEAQYE
jgi:TRAP-type C4-dicarboxylate transport system permease small subunit